MKYISIILFSIVSYQMGEHWKLITALVLIIGMIALYLDYINRRAIKMRKERHEPLVIISKNPIDGRKVLFNDDDLLGLCWHVELSRVRKYAERLKEIYKDAGNVFLQDGLPSEACLPVLELIFKEGEHINETWGEFCDRCLREILKARRKWHKKLHKDRKWYDTFALRQE